MKPPDQNTQHSSQTIFIFIASYCDPELPRTLDDCLQNARHPKDLRFGICWQYDRQQPVDIRKFKNDARFQFVEYPIEQSQGGTWARSKAQQFWKGEPYTLQIDSHMKFERDWDVKLIQMMKKFPSDKPLITANSPVFWYDEQGKLHRDTDRGVPTHKIVDWNPQMGWTIWADYGKPNTQWPGRTRILTGNFVFILGQWNQEVPQDPGHYYHGEEWSLTIRSFTHGYDLFLPEEIVVWHRNELPRRHWEHGQDVVNRKNEIAFERLRMLIYSDDKEEHKKLGKYSLGTVRTIRDYEIYAGMDLKNKKAHPDVFEGNNPDPVTIKSEKDWEQCLTFEEFKTLTWHPGRGPEKQSRPQVAVPREYKLEDLGEFTVFQNDLISDTVRNNHIWERYLQDVFEKYVSPGNTVLEAGCYIGTHTVKLARLCAPGSLFAFEPHPRFHEVLSSNVQRSSLANVQLFQQGLSDTPGNARYAWITEGNLSASGLDDNPRGCPGGSGRDRAMEENTSVTLTTVDSLRLQKLDFIKIDVEGYESKVLNGAMETLRRCKPIVTLECWKSNRVEEYGQIEDMDNLDSDSPLRILQALGYSVQHISGPDFIALPC